ncbi:hypothetical protein CUU66_20415 [Peribacillus deserti]|uniref:Uncharacterized protein n=1 Tax=Peribacillus deserti TaxID=673318 RepID=A0A2N5M162_9BACI|nr:hypothetical protein CUU66_20415 [Peribacillus deserti]
MILSFISAGCLKGRQRPDQHKTRSPLGVFFSRRGAWLMSRGSQLGAGQREKRKAVHRKADNGAFQLK